MSKQGKEDLKYIIMLIIFIVIIALIIRFIIWLLPIVLLLLAIYFVYRFFFKVKDRTNELSKANKKKSKDNIKEAEIVNEKNEE